MLILPIVNKNRLMNVSVNFKDIRKLDSNIIHRENLDNLSEGEIIVNRAKFSESTYKDSKDINACIDFIRSKSLLHPRKILVSTKQENDSSRYNVYVVGQPLRKVNNSLDALYSKAIVDIQKEIPGVKDRGRYLSFEKLGFNDYLTDEKIAKLQRIIRENPDSKKWPELFQKADISDLEETIKFLSLFDFTFLSDTVISEENFQDTLKVFKTLNTRDYKSMNNYYKMAKSNTEIYTKISYINRLIYDKPFLIKSNQRDKQLVKKKNEVDKSYDE